MRAAIRFDPVILLGGGPGQHTISMFPLEAGVGLRDALPGSECVQVKGVGHAPLEAAGDC